MMGLCSYKQDDNMGPLINLAFNLIFNLKKKIIHRIQFNKHFGIKRAFISLSSNTELV